MFEDKEISSKFSDKNDGSLDYIYNVTVKKVTSDFENLQFNTAISQMMIFVNELYKVKSIYKPYLENFIKMFDCICPFIGEEIWHTYLGHEDMITYTSWPTFDESKTHLSVITMAVQVNGKLRDTIEVNKDEEDDVIKEKALSSEKIKSYTEGKTIVKVIVVKNKIVSIVVK